MYIYMYMHMCMYMNHMDNSGVVQDFALVRGILGMIWGGGGKSMIWNLPDEKMSC